MGSTALIILNYNNSKDTRNCIESVLQCNTAPVKFIVVDNGSSQSEQSALSGIMSALFGNYMRVDAASGVCQPILPYATLLFIGANLGYARGNNAGLELAYADPQIDKVMILNNDVLFVEDIIPSLCHYIETLPDAAIVTPLLYKRDMTEYDMCCARRQESVDEMIQYYLFFHWWAFRKKRISEVYPDRYVLNSLSPEAECMEIELPSGSCMLIKKDLFRAIGSFDPNTFLFCEENILCEKIKRIKKKNYLCTRLRCIHLGAQTMIAVDAHKRFLKMSVRSSMYFVKNYTDATLWQRIQLRFAVNIYLLIAAIKRLLGK